MKAQPATLLFLRRNDEILLAMKKRGFGAGLWNGVGGKVEPGESVEAAIKREAEEEIAVVPLNPQRAASLYFDFSEQTDQLDMDVTVFLCTEWQGVPQETEEMAPQWFKISDIPYKQMWEDDRYWLPQVLDGKLIKAHFTFNASNKLVAHDVQEVKKEGRAD